MSSGKLHLDSTQGALLIGIVVAATLYGVAALQAWYYYVNQNDPWTIKALVGVVMALDTLHQVLITHTVYTYLVTFWGDATQMRNLVWSLLAEVIVSGVIALLVQSFLIFRVWHLSNKSIWLTGFIYLLALGEFVTILIFSIPALASFKTFADLATIKDRSISINAMAVVSDIAIAFTLCLLLNRSRTGFQRSDTIIKKLIIFAVNTGLLTSLFAVASLVSIIAEGNALISVSIFIIIGRLYTNSLLATLNVRKIIRGENSEEFNNTSDNFSVSLREFPRNTASSKPRYPTNISIKIDTTMVNDNSANEVEKVGKDTDLTLETISSEGFDRHGNEAA